MFEQVDAVFAVEWQNHLAVRTGHEFILSGQAFADLAVVVNFAVDGQNQFSVAAEQGLSARLGIDNRKAFMRQDGFFAAIDARPVGTAMPYQFGHSEHPLTQFGTRMAQIEYSYNSTHRISDINTY